MSTNGEEEGIFLEPRFFGAESGKTTPGRISQSLICTPSQRKDIFGLDWLKRASLLYEIDKMAAPTVMHTDAIGRILRTICQCDASPQLDRSRNGCFSTFSLLTGQYSQLGQVGVQPFWWAVGDDRCKQRTQLSDWPHVRPQRWWGGAWVLQGWGENPTRIKFSQFWETL